MSSDNLLEVEFGNKEEDFFLDHVLYRRATPTDLFQILELEKASYAPDVAASKNELQFRQHHAAAFFRCAVLEHEESDVDDILGFISGTRCEPCDDVSVGTKTHEPTASTLVVHSVVVKEGYRRFGLGVRMMKDYLQAIRRFNETAENPLSTVVVYAMEDQLPFFIHSGFSVVRPAATYSSDNRNYCLEHELQYYGTIARRDPTRTIRASGREYYIVASFAAGPGTGNPAAVVLLSEEPGSEASKKWMQIVAAEFNLSETAFCWPQNQEETPPNEQHWGIRYYTPKVEVELCGHATLASASILFQTLQSVTESRIVFHASEDDLTMELTEPPSDESSLRRKISMEFPPKPAKELQTRDNRSSVSLMLEHAFSCDLDPLYVGLSDLGDVLVELAPEAFHEIGYDNLNYQALLEWDGYFRGVIVCCLVTVEKGSEESKDDDCAPDFLSRFFGPKAGIAEDPVTGSAHCVLGPYFAEKLGKPRVVGKQMSERGGVVECDVSPEKVRLTGTAVTTMSGTLWI